MNKLSHKERCPPCLRLRKGWGTFGNHHLKRLETIPIAIGWGLGTTARLSPTSPIVTTERSREPRAEWPARALSQSEPSERGPCCVDTLDIHFAARLSCLPNMVFPNAECWEKDAVMLQTGPVAPTGGY